MLVFHEDDRTTVIADITESEFRAAVADVAGPWLAQRGFDRAESLPAGVVFQRVDGVFLLLEYLPEDPPPRSLTIATGLVVDEAGAVRLHGVGAWRLLPSSEYSSWRFVDRDGLVHALRKVREDVLPALEPYWQDSTGLRAAADAQAEEIDDANAAAARSARIDAARKAFAAHDFAAAARQFADAAPEDLLPSDIKKAKIARERS